MVKSTYPECAAKKDEKVLAAVLPRRSIGLVDMFGVNCMQLEVLPKNENKNYAKRYDIVQKNRNLKDNKNLNDE